MKFWMITDTHFGHHKMIEYCSRPEDFSKRILANLKVVQEEDVLIHLGDICIGEDLMWHEMLKKAVKGKMWLVRGNHDNKSKTWYLDHGWDFVADTFQMRQHGKNIMFSHVPIPHTDYQAGLHGSMPFDINIHGHFHNSLHRLQEGKFVVEGEEERNKIDLRALSERHKLLAIEYTDFKPAELTNFIENGL